MGLLGDWLGSKRMENPARGTAQVVAATMPPDSATSSNCNMNLVVSAEGLEPTAVEHSAICPTKKWPWSGTVLPVTVDLANPDRLRIEWDEVPSHDDTSRQRAEATAEAMRKGGAASALGGGAASFGQGEVIVVDANNVDDATRARLAGMGVDVDALIAQAQAAKQAHGGTLAPASPEQPADASGGDGGIADQLEQLGQLRSQGLLSEDEFQKAKRKLLG